LFPSPHFQMGRSAPSSDVSDTAQSDSQPSLRDDGSSLDPDDPLSLHPERDDDLDQPFGGEVNEELASFLKESVAKPATNIQKKRLVGKYPLPKELTPPKMDMPMRLLVPREVTMHDQWLVKMQATSYEAAGPLISLLNGIEGEEELDKTQVSELLKHSLSLLGNCYARFSQERRRKILLGINSQLGHMADEDFESSEVLFGEGAVDRIQKRAEALKTLRRVKQPFRQGGAQGRGLPVHRGKQGPYRTSFNKSRASPYSNKFGRGGKGTKRGQ